MSINDILNDDSFLIMFLGFILIFLVFVIPIGIAIGKESNNKIYGNEEKGKITTEENAKVISKRTQTHPLNPYESVCYVLFEFESNNRIELAIKDSNIYGSFVIGDIGTLYHIGQKYIDFVRTDK